VGPSSKREGCPAGGGGKAKILGLIIDRREVGNVGAFDGFTDEELVADAARRARELGIAGPVAVEDDNKKSRLVEPRQGDVDFSLPKPPPNKSSNHNS